MKEFFRPRLLIPILILLIADTNADICRLFKDGTMMRKPGSCEEFITCRNHTIELGRCPDGELFDRHKSACVDAAAVLAGDEYCAPRCNDPNSLGRWVPDLTSCRGFYYCSDGGALHGYCPTGHHFHNSSQMCIYESTSPCIDDLDLCQLVASGVKFRNETDCSWYSECKNGVLLPTACKKSGADVNYFQVDEDQCVSRNEVRCDAHPKPDKVCGVNGKTITGFVSDQATCRGYFYCKDLGYVNDLEPSWGQCPEGTFFDSVAKKCADPTDVVCPHDRCDGRGTRLVESADNDCHDYWVCVDGMRVTSATCPGDRFFDTTIQGCVHKIIDYPSCDFCSLNPEHNDCK